MATDAADPLFLVEYFREFYAAVLNHRANIESAGAPVKAEDSIEIREADILAEEASPNGEASAIAPDGILALLIDLLEQQAQAVQRRGDVREQRRFREVQYVMAAMADEVMLSLEWFGKEYWSTHLIEERMFGTHDAGSRFFENLDGLLSARDLTRSDVLAVYLLAISLGFRGRLRGVDGDPQIAHYRNQAYATLYQRNPTLPENAPLFPQAYAHTHGGQQPSWLPQLRPWLLAFVGVGAAYLLISHVIWERRASAVSDRIEELNNRRLGSSATSAGGPAAARRGAPRAQH
jgi:type VI secretion system protein ImpK